MCVIAKGFVQKPGIDYTDTYAPVVWMELTRAILHIGASLDWEIHQMDVKTAFLHGNLEEEVYVYGTTQRQERTQKRILGMLHV